MRALADEQVVVKGPAKTVAYAIDSNGDMPAKDFLEQEAGKNAPTKVELAGLRHLFKLMADQGKINNDEQFTKERGAIFGFKKYQARIAAFQEGDVWYLTHGFKKKKNKWPASELDRAERIRGAHLRSGGRQ